MSLKVLNQASVLVNKANNLAIIFKKDISGDNLAAALALALSLKQAGKNIELICPDWATGQFGFLPQINFVKNDFAKLGKSLVIEIKNAKNKLDEFWYEDSGKNIKIFVTSKNDFLFKQNDIKTYVDYVKFDLLITIGIQSLYSLGEFYEANTKIFFETPILNIDNHFTNESYGEINLINLKSSTNAEIIFELLEILGLKIKSEIATILLTGLIGKTDSFQSSKISPRTFLMASKLMSEGADHQEVVRNLYKTKTFAILKLWGKSLAELRTYSEIGLIVSQLKYADFKGAGGGETEAILVFKELVSTLSDARVVVMFAETKPRSVQGYIYVKPPLDLDDLLKELNAKRLNGNIGNFTKEDESLDKIINNIKIKIQNWLKPIQ